MTLLDEDDRDVDEEDGHENYALREAQRLNTHEIIVESHSNYAEAHISHEGRNQTLVRLSFLLGDGGSWLTQAVVDQIGEGRHEGCTESHRTEDISAVSYTHLTLPTICSV